MIQEIIEKAGYICLFLPKFHPELNWIKMVWAYIKDHVRKRIANDNTHTMDKLKQYILEAMEKLHTPEGLDILKKYQRLTFRFMDALERSYRKVS